MLADHVAGLSAIVENFRVGEFWHGEVSPTPAYDELTKTLRPRGVRIRQWLRATSWLAA